MDLQLFNYEGKEIRTALIDGSLVFALKDVCSVLGIANVGTTYSRLPGNMKGIHTMDTLGGKQDLATVNEAGLYKLAFTSRKEEAEKFTDWVASDVLPSIRKTGTYQVKQMTQLEILAASAQQMVEMERKVNALDSKVTKSLEALTAPALDNWKHDINAKINSIIESQGLNHQTFRGDLYAQLENSAGCDITARQANLIKRMKANGATYAECKGISKLDAIDRDAKLRLIFEGIVCKRQAKYAMAGNRAEMAGLVMAGRSN